MSNGGGGTPGRLLSSIEVPVGPRTRPRVARFPGARARRRRAAERLFEELLSLPEETRHHRIAEERFHDAHLFDLLLAAGHEALPGDPREAGEILSLATGLVSLLVEKESTASEIGPEEYSRAFCLAGAAWRLRGDFGQAEAAFEHAGHLPLPVSPAGRGFFCRSYGVLRWDQGRSEEAAALFHQAQRRYSEGQDVREEAVCLALLGMLHVDDGEPGRAAPCCGRRSRGSTPTAGRGWPRSAAWDWGSATPSPRRRTGRGPPATRRAASTASCGRRRSFSRGGWRAGWRRSPERPRRPWSCSTRCGGG